MLYCQLGSYNSFDRANTQTDEPTIAPKRRSGALTNRCFIPPLGESKRSAYVTKRQGDFPFGLAAVKHCNEM